MYRLVILLVFISHHAADGSMYHSDENRINGCFSTLVINVHEALQSHNVELGDLLEYMKHFFKVDECFVNATNISDTLTRATVNGLWSYLHYSPLEVLIEHFLQNHLEIKKLMTKYKSQLTDFLQSTMLIDYIKEKNFEDDDTDQSTQCIVEHYKKIKVVIQPDCTVSDLSLMYVQELWSVFATEFNILSLTAIICDISLGSLQLEITWCVPPHEAELIRPTARFCGLHKITVIAIDDHICYDKKQMVITH